MTVFHGTVTVTNRAQLTQEFGARYFLHWQYLEPEDETTGTWHDMPADDPHISNDGFRLTLTPGDVSGKITFRCLLEDGL